jgi:hypothetical protein
MEDELDEWLGGFVVFITVLAAMFGAALCIACVVWPYEPDGTPFWFLGVVWQSPLMLAWALLIATTGALSWAGMFAGVRACASAWKRIPERQHRRWLAATIGLLVLALFGMPTVASLYPLKVSWPLGDYHSTRIGVISLAVLLPALTAIAGMWFTAVAASDSLDKPKLQPQFEIALFLELSRRVQSLLWFVGIVIGCAVLSTGTLRKAMIAGGWASDNKFPAELVLAYGAYYTLLLIISYLGPYVLVRRAGERLVDHLAGSAAGTRDEAAAVAWQEQRDKLAKTLKLSNTLQESLVGALAILGPIVGGLLSLALPD